MMEGPPGLEHIRKFQERVLPGSSIQVAQEEHVAGLSPSTSPAAQWELLGDPDLSVPSLTAPLVFSPNLSLDYRALYVSLPLASILSLPALSCHHNTLQVTLQPEACIPPSVCCGGTPPSPPPLPRPCLCFRSRLFSSLPRALKAFSNLAVLLGILGSSSLKRPLPHRESSCQFPATKPTDLPVHILPSLLSK